MKNIILLCFVLTLLVSFSSCQNKYNNSQILTKAESLRNSNPDSVLILLENIKTPARLNNKQYATYLLLQAEAKDKTFRDLSNDTLLPISIDYFTKVKLHKQVAYAYFYQNRVYQSQNQIELAIEYCCLAKEYAEKEKDINLLGLIYHDLGDLYKEQLNFNEAIDNYRKGLSYFCQVKNSHYTIYMYKRIGDIFLLNTSLDSALVNYQKALQCAKEEKNQEQIYHTYQAISLSFHEANRFEEAKIYIKNAIETIDDPRINFSDYIYLSGIYLNLNKIDSALIFLNKTSSSDIALNARDEYVQKKLLYKINYIKKDYLSAIYNLEECLIYNDSIYKDIINQRVLEIQKEYENESLENEKNELIIQRLYLFFICLAVISSIPFIVAFFIHKNKKHKFESLKKHQELLFLEEILESKNSKENKLKELLMEKLNVAKKIILIKSHTNINGSDFVKQYYKIFGRNISDELEWDNLYPIFDELYNDFIFKLKYAFPGLVEKELQHCCLIRADFSTEEIALFLSYEYNSVRTNKVRLRKKMGFETTEEFTEYLNNL